MKPGQKVVWMWQPPGGYGYIVPVAAEVVRTTEKRVLIRVEQLKPVKRTVERWVKPENLKEKQS